MEKEQLKIRGFYRLQITEDGEDGPVIKGDSGWQENQVTNLGIEEYLVRNLLGTGGNKSVSFMALGTGTAPASNATSLAGELNHTSDNRKSVTTSIVSSRTAQFTAAFNSAASFVTQTVTIQNIGLFNTSAVTVGTIFAGNTYATSSLATNQNVNATYQIRFTAV